MEIEGVVKHGQMAILTKQDLFLKLSALNYLNTLVKQPKYTKVLGYGMIKPYVMRMAIDLAKNDKTNLCEDICYHPDEDSLYVRCNGIQFCFHCVGVSILEEECAQLSNKDVKWDGIRLQPIAEPLYNLAVESVEKNLTEDEIKDRILSIII